MYSTTKEQFEELKKLYSLRNIKFQREQASADSEAAKNYKLELSRIIDERGYTPDQLFKQMKRRYTEKNCYLESSF